MEDKDRKCHCNFLYYPHTTHCSERVDGSRASHRDESTEKDLLTVLSMMTTVITFMSSDGVCCSVKNLFYVN